MEIFATVQIKGGKEGDKSKMKMKFSFGQKIVEPVLKIFRFFGRAALAGSGNDVS